MLARHRKNVELEMARWLVLLFVASVAVLLLAARIVGAEQEPRLLPDDVDCWARPMQAGSAATFFPEVGPPVPTEEPSRALWRAMRMHRQGMYDEALEGWQQVNLPCETEVWKHTAIAASLLKAGRLEQAEEQLKATVLMAPGNAVPHFYLGMLRLAQARGANNWNDFVGPPVILIAMPQVAPNTRDVYELAAIQELEKAIELAPAIEIEVPLAAYNCLPGDTESLPVVTPLVGDLLEALAADRLATRANNLLGMLYTARGELDKAETCMDAAAAERMLGPEGYRELAQAFESQGRHVDAARACLKDVYYGNAELIPAWKNLDNGWNGTLIR